MINIENEPFDGRLAEIFLSLHKKILLKAIKQQKVVCTRAFKEAKYLHQKETT